MPPLRFQELDADGVAVSSLRGPTKAVKVHSSYLSDKQSGIVSALGAALRELFQQKALPDNPAFFLADVLAAYHDRSQVWTVDGNSILREVDAGGLKVHDARSQLCTLGEFPDAWGLPHVLRCSYLRGIKAVQNVLRHNLHDSFFRPPQPFRVDEGYMAREMCSLRGSTLTYNPARQPFPAINVRTDVLIAGPSADAALDCFAALILCGSLALVIKRECRDVQLLLLDQLVRLRFLEAPDLMATAAAGAQKKRAAPQVLTAAEIEDDVPAYFQAVKRAVLSGKVVEADFVIIAEMPGAQGTNDQQTTAFCLASKSYYLHLQTGPDASISLLSREAQVTHFAGLPHEALYDGAFMHRTAAQAYMRMFEVASGLPYSPSVLEANSASLAEQAQLDFEAGNQFDAFRKLALGVLLSDATTAQAKVAADQLLPGLEDLTFPVGGVPGEAHAAFGALPDIFRILNASAAQILCHANSLRALGVFIGNFEWLKARYHREQLELARERTTKPSQVRSFAPVRLDYTHALGHGSAARYKRVIQVIRQGSVAAAAR